MGNRIKYVVVLLAVAAAVSCQAPGGPAPGTPLTYARLVIETYDPSGAGTGYNRMDFYSAADFNSPITSDLLGSNPNAANTGFAYIDWSGGLASGDYYVKVYENPGQGSGDPEAYAIRVLLAPSTVYTSQTGIAPSGTGWVVDGTAALPNTSTSPLPPTLEPGGFLLRYYPGNDVDWVKITLP